MRPHSMVLLRCPQYIDTRGGICCRYQDRLDSLPAPAELSWMTSGLSLSLSLSLPLSLAFALSIHIIYTLYIPAHILTCMYKPWDNLSNAQTYAPCARKRLMQRAVAEVLTGAGLPRHTLAASVLLRTPQGSGCLIIQWGHVLT